jgi:hypothetical protein
MRTVGFLVFGIVDGIEAEGGKKLLLNGSE